MSQHGKRTIWATAEHIQPQKQYLLCDDNAWCEGCHRLEPIAVLAQDLKEDRIFMSRQNQCIGQLLITTQNN